MIYIDDKFNLTTNEMIRALQSAKLPTDPNEWTAEQVARAAIVLDDAQEEKTARLMDIADLCDNEQKGNSI